MSKQYNVSSTQMDFKVGDFTNHYVANAKGTIPLYRRVRVKIIGKQITEADRKVTYRVEEV